MAKGGSAPERAASVVAWTAIVLGAVARVWGVTQRGSLWLDEASLALNVLTRSFGELLRPLDWGQAAPIGFLWIERALSWHAAAPELWLRLVPLAAGLALPWLMWRLGHRLVGSAAGALGAVAAAGSMLAMRYSTEAKPYATDAAIAAALLLLACDVADAPHKARYWWRLALAMVCGVLLSLPVVFVIAAIVVALTMDAGVRLSAGGRRIGVAGVCASAALFAVLWVTSYSGGAQNSALRDYWAPVMLRVTAPDLLVRLVRVLMELTWVPLRWTGSLLGAAVGTVLWLGGLVAIRRRRRADAVMLALPIAFAAMASAFGAYPLSDRLAFFAVPAVWVAQAGALIWVRNLFLGQRTAEGNARIAVIYVVLVSAALATWQSTDSDRFLREPGSLERTRELFGRVDADAAATPIYVFARSAPAWLIATHDGPWRGDGRLMRWTALAGTRGAPGYENAARDSAVALGAADSLRVESGVRTELVGLAPGVAYRITGAPSRNGPSPGWAAAEARRIVAVAQPEVWLVASHFFGGSNRNELVPLVEALGAAGLRVVEERDSGRDVVALRMRR